MILRVLTLAGGIIGAGVAAQGPGFSRAYVFELEAAERTLSGVIAHFDAAARAAGIDRETALARLRGSALLERRRIDLTRNVERHMALEVQVLRLQAAGPFLRSYYLLRAPDAEALRATVQKFLPTAPRSRAELIFAAIGFIAGTAFARLLLWLPTWPARFRRRRALRS
ncbi:hypothetical protein DSM110093_00990 [Sulfitobacter sp. DSM 110093]|uniref:DUF2937 family protein n=1 Tax=Sulfitobacter sp. DSM 110093 TaxID=2883127 RepID=UPI001FAB8C10|nr:DUF2937 family protein [Sulfitobacter sp. DSM 110093]UOA31227.1 hypothetical protein DSM110093_00990 [Sulfitobacter sp. DSM 110093]